MAAIIQFGVDGDYQDKFLCITKCFYEHKIDEDEKEQLNKKQIEQMLLENLEEVYELCGFDTQQSLKLDPAYSKPPHQSWHYLNKKNYP